MPHILIVEDEPATSWALAEGLSDDGFTIDTFPTAEDAWTWLQRGRSDLVISDLRLPGMSGLDLARKLRNGRHAQPVIIVTAYGGPEVQRDLRRAGVADCFSKPFPMDSLRRSVHRALEHAAQPLRRAARRRSGKVAPRRAPRVNRRAA
jgi:DNA-binding NtrC family response regulator